MHWHEFIAALGGAAAWPMVAHAQQAMPEIGFFNGASSHDFAPMAAFRHGLKKVEIGPRLLAHELMRSATSVAFLANPSDPARAEEVSRDVQSCGRPSRAAASCAVRGY
jgi:hypothetical protein